jgi:hypothetical protein
MNFNLNYRLLANESKLFYLITSKLNSIPISPKIYLNPNYGISKLIQLIFSYDNTN